MSWTRYLVHDFFTAKELRIDAAALRPEDQQPRRSSRPEEFLRDLESRSG